MILPGSCTAHHRRHTDRTRESSSPRPVTLLVSVNSLTPASPTAGTPPGLHTHNRVQPDILHHEGVPPLELSDLSNPHYSRRSDTFTPSSTPQQ